MSSVRGGSLRGRGRGSTQQAPSRGRGTSSTRARSLAGSSIRGNTSSRGTIPPRHDGAPAPRGSTSTRPNAFIKPAPTQQGAGGVAKTRGSWQDRYQALTKARERERSDAVRQGLIADPEHPRTLSEAITPVGTCQDMCAEFERVQRVVQKDVWDEEKDVNRSAFSMTPDEPDESRMVKKFRRAAAGLEEQLPSDLRPPPVLKRTCDYLFDDVIGHASSLAQVHHFVWDRTRAIRNDFSIQQLTKPDELRMAVDCYERIARFHILSLHQLALPERPYSKYDWQQEREQLDRTLLSLMQYYDDSRGRIDLPNEAEFRAYCVIFQLQDPTPDLEDRVQSWPRELVHDIRVQKALELYMAACNIMDAQGPLKPRANHLIARQDWQRFWSLVVSREVSYLMACVAEIYFNLVRRTVLNALFRTSRASSNLETPDWTTDFLCDLLAFDDADEVITYCERFGFTFKDRDDGHQYLDLNSVKGKILPEPTAGMPKQLKTSLVEDKRFGRTLPAVINGMSVRIAQEAGLANDEDLDDGMDDVQEEGKVQSGIGGAVDDDESLFIPDSRQSSAPQAQRSSSLTNGLAAASETTLSTFSGTGTGPTFGKPSFFSESSNVSAPSQGIAAADAATTLLDKKRPTFEFSLPATTSALQPTTTPPLFDFNKDTRFGMPSGTGDGHTVAKPPSFGEPSLDQGGIFSKAAAPSHSDAQSPFQFTGPAQKDPNSPGPSPFSVNFPSTTLSKDSSQQPKSPFTIGQLAGTPVAAAPSITSQQPETKVSQPHFTTSPTTSPSTSNQPALSSGLNSGLRRPSTSHDTRPKKPSPLSNSFSASEDNNNAIETESPPDVPKQPVKEFPGQQSQRSPSLVEICVAPPSQDVNKDFENNITRIAEELVNDPISGFLKQYVEYVVNRTITQVQEELATQRLNAEADDWRVFTLQVKYGKRWRDLFWRRRLAKSGRERRQRRQRRLQERSIDGSDSASRYDTESIRASSRAGSVIGSRSGESRNDQELVDGLFQQTMSSRQWNRATARDQQARPGSKRPISSHSTDAVAPSRESGHKRLKSTSHVDDRGRVAKPTVAPTSHPHANILKRSSFLGFSLSKDTSSSNNNTTMSNYFKLKALGINRADTAASPRGTKRRLSEFVQTASHTSPPSLRSSSRLGSTPEHTLADAPMPPPSSAPSNASKANAEDEALFARLKAARESLQESTSYYKSEASKEDDHNRSMDDSKSPNDSPSLDRARAEARSRASYPASEAGAAGLSHGVPAYRLRESKFVPREQYWEAIERSRDFRSSRSRETSRPDSRAEYDMVEKAPIPPAAAPGVDNIPDRAPNQFDERTSLPNGPNGVSHVHLEHIQQSAFSSNSFSPFASQPPLSFANHTTKLPEQNPFLHASVANPFTNFGSQPVFNIHPKQPPIAESHDHTIRPSQIDQSLENSFGSSHSFGQSHFRPMVPASPTPPQAQQNSYMVSQPISLLSDDDDDAPAEDDAPVRSENCQDLYDASDTDAATEELVDNASDYDEPDVQYSHPNPYMAISHQGGDEDGEEQGWQSQMEDEVDYDSRYGPSNGCADEPDEDDEAADADIDEDETEDISGEDDEDGYEYEVEDEDDQPTPPSHQWHAKPEPNPELQGFGNSAEEAIELSD